MPVPDHLQAARYISLATFRKNGDAVPTPIWAAPVDGKLYAFSEKKAGKMKRIRNSPRARIAPCSGGGKLLGIWQDAEAYEVSDPAEIAAAYAALHQKYGWQMRLTDFGARLARRYDKRSILRIEMP